MDENREQHMTSALKLLVMIIKGIKKKNYKLSVLFLVAQLQSNISRSVKSASESQKL